MDYEKGMIDREDAPTENPESLPLENLLEQLSDATSAVRKAIDRQNMLRRYVDKKIKMNLERAQQIDSRYSDIINPPTQDGDPVMREEGISRGERY